MSPGCASSRGPGPRAAQMLPAVSASVTICSSATTRRKRSRAVRSSVLATPTFASFSSAAGACRRARGGAPPPRGPRPRRCRGRCPRRAWRTLRWELPGGTRIAAGRRPRATRGTAPRAPGSRRRRGRRLLAHRPAVPTACRSVLGHRPRRIVGEVHHVDDALGWRFSSRSSTGARTRAARPWGRLVVAVAPGIRLSRRGAGGLPFLHAEAEDLGVADDEDLVVARRGPVAPRKPGAVDATGRGSSAERRARRPGRAGPPSSASAT